MCACTCIREYIHYMHVGVCEGQKRTLDSGTARAALRNPVLKRKKKPKNQKKKKKKKEKKKEEDESHIEGESSQRYPFLLQNNARMFSTKMLTPLTSGWRYEYGKYLLLFHSLRIF